MAFVGVILEQDSIKVRARYTDVVAGVTWDSPWEWHGGDAVAYVVTRAASVETEQRIDEFRRVPELVNEHGSYAAVPWKLITEAEAKTEGIRRLANIDPTAEPSLTLAYYLLAQTASGGDVATALGLSMPNANSWRTQITTIAESFADYVTPAGVPYPVEAGELP